MFLGAAFRPGNPHRFFSPVARPIRPGSRTHESQKPLVAEADGNRTRQRVCTRSSILKFGDGRVAGCDLVPFSTDQCRSPGSNLPSGFAVTSWMFATRLQATQA